MHTSSSCSSQILVYIHCFLHTHMLSLSHSLCIPLLFLRHTCPHTNAWEKEREREKAQWTGKAFVSRWRASHPLPTCRASSDSASCSRGLCYADTLQLASLPTPINAATQLHPLLSFSPFLSLPLCQWSYDTTVAAREPRGTWVEQRRGG